MEEEIDWQASIITMSYEEFVAFIAWLWSDEDDLSLIREPALPQGDIQVGARC